MEGPSATLRNTGKHFWSVDARDSRPALRCLTLDCSADNTLILYCREPFSERAIGFAITKFIAPFHYHFLFPLSFIFFIPCISMLMKMGDFFCFHLQCIFICSRFFFACLLNRGQTDTCPIVNYHAFSWEFMFCWLFMGSFFFESALRAMHHNQPVNMLSPTRSALKLIT